MLRFCTEVGPEFSQHGAHFLGGGFIIQGGVTGAGGACFGGTGAFGAVLAKVNGFLVGRVRPVVPPKGMISSLKLQSSQYTRAYCRHGRPR